MSESDRRIVSIDALRGFDMLMLTGGAAIVASGLNWWYEGNPPTEIMAQLRHAHWGGAFTCWDMVMPLFIFIVGASMPFAFHSYRKRGGKNWRMRTSWRIFRRVCLLFVLGMLVQGRLTSADPEKMHLFCNTLQAIAEGYLIAAIVFLCGGRVRAQLTTCIALLVAYWAALRFIPYGNSSPGLFLPHDNLAIWIDRQLQGKWQDGTPYSWILTSLSFGALTLLGVLGGQAIRLLSRGRSAWILGSSSAACIVIALLLEQDTPIIKHIFTTTMVLWSGGWCLALLLIFHLIFDFSPAMNRAATPLKVIGANAMLAYLLAETPGIRGSLWNSIAYPLFNSVSSLTGDAAPFTYNLLSYTLFWLVLYFLYQHKALLKV